MPRRSRPRDLRRRARASLVVLSLTVMGGVSAGCGADPPEIGPRGVDTLQVPTVDPRAADFTAEVDNRWFPLSPGSTRTYRVRGHGEVVRRTATVLGATDRIAGVAVTGLREVARDAAGSVVARRTSWYAQDREGNVWLFGRSVSATGDPQRTRGWRAGEDGARPGLMMAARPRRGDGYVVQPPEEFRQRAQVVTTDGTATVPAGSYDDVVELTLTWPGETGDPGPQRMVRARYAPGVGPVERTGLDDGATAVLIARGER